MTNGNSNEPVESPTTNIDDDLQDDGDDDEGYQGTFIRKHTPPSKKDKQPETKDTTLIDIEVEVEDSDEDASFDQGTFIRKQTPPSKRETPSKGSSGKLPAVPPQEMTVPPKDPTTQPGPVVQRNIPSSREAPIAKKVHIVREEEAPKREDDGSYYTETVYTPPPLFDYEDDDDDDDMMEEELTRALLGKSKEASSPVPTTHPIEETDGCESASHTVPKDEVQDNESESEEDSSYDLEKVMAQHAVANTSQPWPFKPPLLSRTPDAESDPTIKRTNSFSKQPQRASPPEAQRRSFDEDHLHGKYPSPPQGRRRSFTDKCTSRSREKNSPPLARRMSFDGGQRKSYTEDFPRSQNTSRALLDRHISEAPVRKRPGRDKRDDQSEVLLKRRSSDSHIQWRSHEARKNSDPSDLAPVDTLKLKKEADKEREKKENKKQEKEAKKETKKREKRSKGASSLSTADVFY